MSNAPARMSSSTRSRLKSKLKRKKRQMAPCYSAFNRWVFLAQHNRIMFANREVLQSLQDEYESGKKSGDEIKQQAANIVKKNVEDMSTLSASLKSKINGREVFNLTETHRQLWLKCVCPNSIGVSEESATAADKLCLIGCRSHPVQNAGIVDVFFGSNKTQSVYQYQFGMQTRSAALSFSSALYSALSSGKVYGDKPVNGAFAILCINLSHTPNEQVKFRVINGTVHPSQSHFRDTCVVKAQALIRGFLQRCQSQRRLTENDHGTNGIREDDSAKSAKTVRKRLAKKQKKQRQKQRKRLAVIRIQKYARRWLARNCLNVLWSQKLDSFATILQLWWLSIMRKREIERLEYVVKACSILGAKLRRYALRLSFAQWKLYTPNITDERIRVIGEALVDFVSVIDSLMKKMRRHHCRVIKRVKRAIHKQLPYADVYVYGSWPLALSIPSSDIDIVVDYRAGSLKAQRAGFWRAAIPECVQSVGRQTAIGSSNGTHTSSQNLSSAIHQSPSTHDRNRSGSCTNAFYTQAGTESLFSRQEYSHGVSSELTFCTYTDSQKSPLELVSAEMSSCFWVRSIRFIHNSRIPVIKAVCSSGSTIGTGLAVEIDISEMTNSNQGVRARDYVREQLLCYPNLRLLIIFLKQLLHHYDAGGGGITGSLKSFALIVLLISYYQNKNEDNLLQNKDTDSASNLDKASEEEEKAKESHQLASELLGFLKLFGSFDFSEQGISATTGVFSLRESNLFNKYPCCIMWGDVNVGANATKIFYIQQLMLSTLSKIKSGMDLSRVAPTY